MTGPIVLTWAELRVAAQIGTERRLQSLMQGFGRAAHSRRVGAWQIDIMGAAGEIAVAKALGVYWPPGVGTFKLPDVGALHVRATEYSNGHLLIRPDDPAGVYVMVIVQNEKCWIPGWIHATAARLDRWKARPDPNGPVCWSIPQAELCPIDSLKSKLHSAAMPLSTQLVSKGA